ncbi:MAG: YhbY family RNA-binding protein [Oscillospiraceae bacterium]|jgi:RNA-binding protein|nr:YhbY family RNA-binding protein [Oscillospiraceae bacterium]
MLNSRQRAQLRALANPLETILQVGKDGISDNTVKTVADALRVREIIKCRVLETAGLTAKEAADALSQACLAETVQTIGSRFVLYKENREIDKEKRIRLVK